MAAQRAEGNLQITEKHNLPCDKGVWIDEREALIVSSVGKQIIAKRITSNVEQYHVGGGSGSATPYGPQDAVSETGQLRRKKQQLKRFFQKVIKELKPAMRIYIIGPAKAKEGLRKELSETNDVSFQSLVVESADSMTQNQLKARIKSYFVK